MTSSAKNLGNLGGESLHIGGAQLYGRLAERSSLGALFSLRWLGLPTSACAACPEIWRLSHGLEMVAAGHYARGDAANRLKAEGPGLGPHAVQIAGREPSIMAEAARLAQDFGAAMIDIKMGCPAKKVTNGYAGSHLMRDMGLAVSLIGATVAAVHIPVTLKMAEGIAMLTVHGRTRCQFYSAKADWTAIAEVKKAVSIPVVANGDCASLADAASMMAESGADAGMIGRSAIGRPWFVGDVAHFLTHGKARTGTPLAERKSAALEHFETLLEMFGHSHGLRHARKHLAAYAERAGVRDGAALRQRVVRLECPNEVRSTLCQLFDSPLLTEAA
jgi:tRNA-dihydrouridine synthase B